MLYKGNGIQLTICAYCSWETALNAGFDVAFDNIQDWKETREKAEEN
jgi:hypothetical protein